MAGIGHNSGDTDVITGAAKGRLLGIVERAERLLEDRATVNADLKEVLAEAKGDGFDTKTIRKLLTLRAKDRNAVIEANAVLALYASVLGCEDLV